jgi:hypothetical protein
VGTETDIDVTETDLDEEVLIDLRHNLEVALVLADRIRDEGAEEGDTVIDRSAADS